MVIFITNWNIASSKIVLTVSQESTYTMEIFKNWKSKHNESLQNKYDTVLQHRVLGHPKADVPRGRFSLARQLGQFAARRNHVIGCNFPINAAAAF